MGSILTKTQNPHRYPRTGEPIRLSESRGNNIRVYERVLRSRERGAILKIPVKISFKVSRA